MLRKMVGENEVISRKSKVDLSRIPPCQDSLIPHLERVNHRMAGYRRAAEAIWEAPMPHARGQGWEVGSNNILEPVWSRGPILPPSLVDLLEARVEENKDEEGEEGYDEVEDFDIDFDLLIDDDYL